MAVLAVAGTAVAVQVTSGPSHSPTAGTADPTSVATVRSQPLSAQAEVAATLGQAGSYTVVNQATGTITGLPAIGQVVWQGQPIYRVNGSPVILLYGPVPAWRTLFEGMAGPDVTELNTDLASLGEVTRAALGPRSDWDVFGAETAFALERLQARLGLTVTGSLPLGQAAFLPSATQVSALGSTTVLGAAVTPGSALLTATSTTPVVTVNLDPSQQSDVKVGDQVTITLPGGQVTPGSVSSVGTVATVPAPDSANSASSASASNTSGAPPTPTITVEVALRDPKAAGSLSQAPVQVAITTGQVPSALVVPVNSLLAQADGGYAVEVTGPRGQHLVGVTLGLFDDAAGLVQVTGSALAAGQHVVVPSS